MQHKPLSQFILIDTEKFLHSSREIVTKAWKVEKKVKLCFLHFTYRLTSAVTRWIRVIYKQ